MTKFRILSIAAQDLAKAMEYYETKSAGLGGDFLDEYERTISRICRFPEAWASSAQTSEDVSCVVFLMPYFIPGRVKELL